MTLISSSQSIAQDQRRNVNFVISIDGQIVVGSMIGFKIIALSENDTREIIEADYAPGNLSLEQSDYDKLLNENIKTILLAFEYTENCKNQKQTYSYEIDIRKGWLKHYYYVLHIYNTDKKRYKNVYDPLEGKTYTFEFDYPGGSMIRVKKKSKSVKDDCN